LKNYWKQKRLWGYLFHEEKGIKKGKEIGKKEGKTQGKKEVAVELIAEVTHMDIEEIKKLKKQF